MCREDKVKEVRTRGPDSPRLGNVAHHLTRGVRLSSAMTDYPSLSSATSPNLLAAEQRQGCLALPVSVSVSSQCERTGFSDH